jgi:hypothetical protein
MTISPITEKESKTSWFISKQKKKEKEKDQQGISYKKGNTGSEDPTIAKGNIKQIEG